MHFLERKLLPFVIQISLKFVSKFVGPTNNQSSFVQLVAWHQTITWANGECFVINCRSIVEKQKGRFKQIGTFSILKSIDSTIKRFGNITLRCFTQIDIFSILKV